MAVDFNTLAPMDRIITVLQSAEMVTAGLQRVYKGVPESLANQVSAYLFLGPMDVRDKVAGLLELDITYYLSIGYRVAGAEATAENVLSAVIDKFIEIFYNTERPGRLNNTCRTCNLDFSRVGRGAYDQVAAQEFRIYPMGVEVTLQSSLT